MGAVKAHCLWALLCLAMAGCATLAPREARVDFTLGTLLGEITTSEDGAAGRIRELLPAPEDPHDQVYARRRPGFTTSDGYRVDGAWLNINPESGRVSSFSFVMGEESCFPLVDIPNFGKAFKRPALHVPPLYVWEIKLELASVTISVFNDRQGCLRAIDAGLRNQWAD